MEISLQQAAQLLQDGEVVGIPTETVYGLAASVEREDGIRKIFALKGRPSNNPLIVHISCLEQLKDVIVGELDNDTLALARYFWPGPLTLILPVHPAVSKFVTAGLTTVGVRIPDHPLTRELLDLTGPLVAPSANLSGSPSATSRSHVEADFGKDLPVLEGGFCQNGLESTILSRSKEGWQVGRLGAIPIDVISVVLGYEPLSCVHGSRPICPGAFYKHYAPQARLYLSSMTPYEKKMGPIVGFSNRNYPSEASFISMGSLEDPLEIARHLYATLRKLDEEQHSSAWIDVDFNATGLLATVHERLMRAASSVFHTEINQLINLI